MQIAMIARKLNVAGGVQRHVLSIGRELERRGHRVTLYAFVVDREHCYPQLIEGMRIVSLGVFPQPSRIRGFRWLNVVVGMARERAACRALARRIDPATELLNPHDHLAYRVAAWYKQRVRDIPSVWTMHDMPTKLFSLFRAQEVGMRIRFLRMKRFMYRMFDWWDARHVRVQNQIVVLDRRDQGWVRQYFGREAVVVRNGLDIQAFPYQARKPPVGRRVRILMHGIFMPHRRFEDGIEALRILRERGYNAELTILGEYRSSDAYTRHIADLVDRSGLRERVFFAGGVGEVELREHYARHDIFFFPNHLQSWGLVVFEAMATGMPVIVSQSAGASEALRHRENALLVAPKSPVELAGVAAELIEHPDLYRSISVAGRRLVENDISWRRTAAHMENLFRGLVPNV